MISENLLNLSAHRGLRRKEGRKASNASMASVTRLDDHSTSKHFDTVSVDDNSEATSKAARKARAMHLLNLILLWTRNIQKLHAAMLTKAFYKWRYQSHATINTTVAEEDQSEQRALAVEQKNSYLLLFAENEKLREQLSDLRKTHAHNERQLRFHGLRLNIFTILRKRIMLRFRGAFDIWLNNVRMLGLLANTSRRSLELMVGLQQVESERHHVRETEEMNYQLRTHLSMAIWFFKWKSKHASQQLAEERKLHEEQRRVSEKLRGICCLIVNNFYTIYDRLSSKSYVVCANVCLLLTTKSKIFFKLCFIVGDRIHSK
jgi:hypothetical protein